MSGILGFGMIDPQLNNRRNKWHQKRYRIRIPKKAMSKKWIDAYYSEQSGEVIPPVNTDVGFPLYMFPGVEGSFYDAMEPRNRGADTTTDPVVLNGPVGYLFAGFGSTPMRQYTAANQPTYVQRAGRPALLFDGVSDHMFGDIQAPSNWLTLPRAITYFASFYFDADVAGKNGYAHNNKSLANVSIRPMLLSSSASGCRVGNVRMNGAANFVSGTIWKVSQPLNEWFTIFWEMEITAMKIAGVGTGTGTVKSWYNDEAPITTAIVPDRGSAANSTVMNNSTLGCTMSLVAPQDYYNGCIGRCGYFDRKFTDAERTEVKKWMRGSTYVPPITVAP